MPVVAYGKMLHLTGHSSIDISSVFVQHFEYKEAVM